MQRSSIIHLNKHSKNKLFRVNLNLQYVRLLAGVHGQLLNHLLEGVNDEDGGHLSQAGAGPGEASINLLPQVLVPGLAHAWLS